MLTPQALEQVKDSIHRLYECRQDSVIHTNDLDTKVNMTAAPRFQLYSSGKHVQVYMCFTPTRIGIDPIRKVHVEQTKSGNTRPRTIVFVSHSLPTSAACNYCQEISADDENPCEMECWTFNDFAFCILDHKSQPKFTVLPDDHCKDAKKLPQMLTTDPVARWYGLKPGNLISCVRGMPDGKFMVVTRRVRKP